jgi:hypothetical protein
MGDITVASRERRRAIDEISDISASESSKSKIE